LTDELNSRDFFDQQFGNFRGGKLVAYNRFVPGIHPATGAPIHWLTVAGHHPRDARAAWLLIRYADGHDEPVRVFDQALAPHPFLVSTRTIEFAPWNKREFYTGGYDGAANNRRNHNGRWHRTFGERYCGVRASNLAGLRRSGDVPGRRAPQATRCVCNHFGHESSTLVDRRTVGCQHRLFPGLPDRGVGAFAQFEWMSPVRTIGLGTRRSAMNFISWFRSAA
jgi:hypothetical protein